MSSSSSHRRRVLSALFDGRSSVLPVISVNQAATAEVMNRVGIGWPQAHVDAEKMSGLALAAQRYLDFENVRVPFDQIVEAEALGARVWYGGEFELPEVSMSLPYSDASELVVEGDIMSKGRIAVVLDAISRLRRNPECEAPIISGIVGPFSVIAQGFGLERCLKWTIMKPDSLEKGMESVTPFLISYAKEQVRRGADILSIEDMTSSPSMINPKFFIERGSKYLGQIIDSIDVPVILHICGDATRIVERMIELGPSVVHLDVETDLVKAKQAAIRGRVKLAGNLSPVNTLFRGTEEDVERAVIKAVQLGIDLVSPGCSLSPMTPSKNIAAMVRATKELEATRGSHVGLDG